MPEQPQWPERTLDMPPQDPWADAPTAPSPPTGRPMPAGGTAPFPPVGPGAGQAEWERQPEAQSPFSQGRARVTPRGPERHTAEHEPTGTGWPGAEPPAAAHGMSWRWSELRRGGEWTSAAVLFAFVCWGIWAISEGGSLGTPFIVFLVTLIVAVGVFCLSRVVGYYVLERAMGRTRRTARGSHLVTALFLAGVGIADLRMVGWVMTAWNWVVSTAS